MRHFCIYEINRKSMESTFIENFNDEYGAAQEYCTALNNFTDDKAIYYCIRCLDET